MSQDFSFLKIPIPQSENGLREARAKIAMCIKLFPINDKYSKNLHYASKQ